MVILKKKMPLHMAHNILFKIQNMKHLDNYLKLYQE